MTRIDNDRSDPAPNPAPMRWETAEVRVYGLKRWKTPALFLPLRPETPEFRNYFAMPGVGTNKELREMYSLRDIQREVHKFTEHVKQITGKEIRVGYNANSVLIQLGDGLEKPKVLSSMVLNAVIKVTGLTFEELISPMRDMEVVNAKVALIYLLKEYIPGLSKMKIAKLMKKHHSTIIHHLYSAQGYIENGDKVFNELLDKIRKEVAVQMGEVENPVM